MRCNGVGGVFDIVNRSRGRVCGSRSRRFPSGGSLRKRSDVSTVMMTIVAVGGSSPPFSIQLPAPTVNRALSSRYDQPDQRRQRDQHRHDHHDSRDVGSRAGLRHLVGGGTMAGGTLVEEMIAELKLNNSHTRR
jgi:hypothetical protein